MTISVSLFDLLMGFSTALEMVHPALPGHHTRAAYFSLVLAEKLGLPPSQRRSLIIAAMLHDIGTVPMRTETRDLIFEINEGQHCLAGKAFCDAAGLPASIGSMVLRHHTPWCKDATPDLWFRLSNIIHLADRLDVALRTRSENFSGLTDMLCATQKNYAPEHLAALRAVAADPAAVARASDTEAMLAHLTQGCDNRLGPRQLLRFCGLFSLIIDAKSPFTATHSTGVAHTARALLRLTGLADQTALHIIFVAGLLHDIGKLAVPLDLLEKPEKLSDVEFKAIQRHADLSLQLLGGIPGFTCIREWGALHHERLNGGGYPLGLTERRIRLPVRIMAVADVFTALTEDRPYRAGMDIEQALAVMRSMSENHGLDKDVTGLLEQHVRQIDCLRVRAQRRAASHFERLRGICTAPSGCPTKGLRDQRTPKAS